jgi:ABC-type transport system substrate-binding protein
VTLDIKDQAPPVFATNITTASNPAYFFTYAVQDTFADGQTLFGPTGALNPFHASDSVMNKLLRQGAAVRSAKARDALYSQLSQRVVQQAWFDIVYQSDYVWFVNKKAIKGDRMWPHMSYPWLRGWSPA